MHVLSGVDGGELSQRRGGRCGKGYRFSQQATATLALESCIRRSELLANPASCRFVSCTTPEWVKCRPAHVHSLTVVETWRLGPPLLPLRSASDSLKVRNPRSRLRHLGLE